MKTYKFLLIILVAFCSIGCSIGNHDFDGDNENNAQTHDKPTKMVYHIQSLYDLPLVLDIEASYTNLDGEVTKERITSLPWSATVENFEEGTKATLSLSFTRKVNPDFSKSAYSFGSNTTLSFSDKKGEITDRGNSGSVTCSAGKLNEGMQYYIDEGLEFSMYTQKN